eukprot:gene7841-8690_t
MRLALLFLPCILCLALSANAIKINVGVKAVDISQTLQYVWDALVRWYKDRVPDKNPPPQFYNVIYQIQRAITDEIVSRNPRALLLTPEQRQKELLHFIKVASRGGDIDFARVTFGKSLFAFMKSKLNIGLKPKQIDKAANNFLSRIKTSIGSDMFDEVFAKRGDATLIFAIDTTGSMKDEIAAAKAIAKTIITETREFKVDYILSPFNDPTHGPIVYKNHSQRAEFVYAIDDLEAKGGGDCPELTFTGILEALNAGPRFGSSMFVFTDADAKDATPDNINAVKVAAYSSGVTINFFAKTESCAGGTKPFYDVASFTSGQVFSLADSSELRRLTRLVKSSLHNPSIISSARAGNRNKRRTKRAIITKFSKTYSIPVDDTVGTLVVSVTVEKSDTARYVQLYSPIRREWPTNVNLSAAKVYEIADPKPGIWLLRFPSKVGSHDYIARALSKKLIQFGFIFFHKFLRKNTLIPTSHPLLGEDVHMYLSISGLENVRVPSMRVDFLREDGSKLRSGLKLYRSKGSSVFNTTFKSFKESFKVRLRGATKEGYVFQRLSEKTVKAQPILVRSLYGDRDYTVIQGKKMLLIFEVLNRGKPATFLFDCICKLGTPILPFKKRRIWRRGYFRINYFAPKGAQYKGVTDQLVVSVKGLKGDVYVYTVVKVLIL